PLSLQTLQLGCRPEAASAPSGQRRPGLHIGDGGGGHLVGSRSNSLRQLVTSPAPDEVAHHRGGVVVDVCQRRLPQTTVGAGSAGAADQLVELLVGTGEFDVWLMAPAS